MRDMTLLDEIESLAREMDECRVIGYEDVSRLGKACDSVRKVELTALEAGIVPARYVRNVGTIGVEGQRRLLEARAGIVGLGGLGGYVAEALARMGVGHLTLVDGDVFEDHNLNRQLLSREGNLGTWKADAACERIAEINAAVETACHHEWLTANNIATFLEDVDVVVDALDRLTTRLVLQDGAREADIPMVHGSIGGFLGQVMTVMPGDAGLHGLYGDGDALPEQGLEAELGTPAVTPMTVAAWEAQEVVKLLTGCGELLRDRLLVFDMSSGSSELLQLG